MEFFTTKQQVMILFNLQELLTFEMFVALFKIW
jgi:hypothetical protein